MPVRDRAWKGVPAQRARDWLAAHTDWPTQCARCGGHLERNEKWIAGHIHDRQAYPELTFDYSNLQVECVPCSTHSGAVQGNARRNRGAPSTSKTKKTTSEMSVSGGVPQAPAHLPSVDPQTLPEWYPLWPSDGVPPRYWSGSHPRATGTYAWDVLEWALDNPGIHPKKSNGLRSFQMFALASALEHDEDGNLCWPTVLLGMPRQLGKSWLLRNLAMWRLHCEERFGEAQTIVHAAAKVIQVRNVWDPTARWALREHPDQYRVRMANGTERLDYGNSAWLPQAANDQLGVGLSVSLALVDEAWAVHEPIIANAIAPAQVSAANPQMWIVSTAGRKLNNTPSTLYPGFRKAALADVGSDDPSTLIIEWSSSGDPSSVDSWKAASPYWDAQREKTIRREWAKAFGDMEAVTDFRMQWMNDWPADAHIAPRWIPSYQTDRSVGKVGDAPQDAICAIETALDGATWGVAACWPHSRDRVRGRTWTVTSAAEAAAIVGSRRVWCHESVGKAPALQRLRVERMTVGAARAATATLRTLLAESRLTQTGIADEVWKGVKTQPADGGEVISAAKSAGDVSALKALSWAAWAVESKRQRTGSLVH